MSGLLGGILSAGGGQQIGAPATSGAGGGRAGGGTGDVVVNIGGTPNAPYLTGGQQILNSLFPAANGGNFGALPNRLTNELTIRGRGPVGVPVEPSDNALLKASLAGVALLGVGLFIAFRRRS